MKHTWNENGYEYFVTDEKQTKPLGEGWAHVYVMGSWCECVESSKPLLRGCIYRRKPETPEEKLIREQRENGYCCFKATKHAMPTTGKGEGWEYFTSRWKTSNYSIFYTGNIYRKKREDIKAEYEALQERRKLETQELIYCEYFGGNETVTIHGDDFTRVFRGPLEIQVLEASCKELKQRREQEKKKVEELEDEVKR